MTTEGMGLYFISALASEAWMDNNELRYNYTMLPNIPKMFLPKTPNT